MTVSSLVGSTTSVVVSGVFFAVLAWKRDALMVSFFVGSIANGILSKVLKRLLDQSRPPELETADMTLKPSDGGMPSSHAMSLGFIGTFTALNLPWTRIPLLAYVLISLAYRIRVKLHTWEQVSVGLALGSCNGAVWWKLCRDTGMLEWVTANLLDPRTGLLPWPFLAVPALLGAVVVGSVERRISEFLKSRTKND